MRNVFANKRDKMVYYRACSTASCFQLRKMVLLKGTELQDQNLLTQDKKLKEN